jgi:hypothetical protein
MLATKSYTLEDTIEYQMADCTITEVAKQLQFCATEAHQTEKTIVYTKALKAYLIERLQAL